MRRIIGLVLVASLVASPAAAQEALFSDGVHVVGTDIVSGTYQAGGASAGCYWARLSGLSGETDDIIANDTPTGRTTVEVAPTDIAFESSGCGTWTLITATVTPAVDGTTPYGAFLLGVGDIAERLGSLPSSVAEYQRWSGDAYTDAVAFLITVRPDDCYMPLYIEAWRLAGAIATMQGIAMEGNRAVRQAFGRLLEVVFTPEVLFDAMHEASSACAVS